MDADRLGSIGVDGLQRWRMRRNCALTPRQTAAGYAALCALLLPIGTAWWWLGYPLVAAFTLAELLAAAALLLCHARHAVDSETLALHADGRLLVEQRVADRVQLSCLDGRRLRLALAGGPPPLVALLPQEPAGARVLVGCHLPGARRAQLLHELRAALRALPAAAAQPGLATISQNTATSARNAGTPSAVHQRR